MNKTTIKVGAVALVMVLLVTAISCAGVFSTNQSTTYENPESSTYAMEYDHNGLNVTMDYTNDNYSISGVSQTDNVGLIVADQLLVQFSPLADNVNVYHGTYTDTFSSSTSTTYSITMTVTNGTSTGIDTESDQSYITTAIALMTYYHNMTVSMTIGGTAYTGFTFSNGILSIPKSAVTGSVVITASATEETYTFTSTVTSGTSHTGTIYAGSGISYTFVPYSSDYTYPETVTCNVTHTYDATTGTLTVIGQDVTQNITVTATCKSMSSGYTYSEITTALTGSSTQTGTPTPDDPIEIVSDTYYRQSYNMLHIADGSTSSITRSNEISTINVTFDSAWSIYKLSGSLDNSFVKSLSAMQNASTDNTLFYANHTYIVKIFDAPSYYDIRVASTTGGEQITDGVAFTPTADYNTLWVRFYQSSQTAGSYEFKVMIVESTTVPTTYEKYGSYYPIELRSVGSYADTYTNGVITRNVGYVAMDGVTIKATTTYNGQYAKGFMLSTRSVSSTQALMSNMFAPPTKTDWYSELPNHIVIQGSQTNATIFIMMPTDTEYNTVELFNGWLQTLYNNGTPVIIEYPLLTPTTENVTLYNRSGGLAPEIAPTTPTSATINTPLTDQSMSESGSYVKTTTITSITSLTINYEGNVLTLTSDIGSLTYTKSRIYLINKVIDDSQYYVYDGAISGSYYGVPNDIITYNPNNANSYVFEGTTLGVGSSITATSTSASSLSYTDAKSYASGTTPITLSPAQSHQYTILPTEIISQPDNVQKSNLLISVLLIVGLLACCYFIFRT